MNGVYSYVPWVIVEFFWKSLETAIPWGAAISNDSRHWSHSKHILEWIQHHLLAFDFGRLLRLCLYLYSLLYYLWLRLFSRFDECIWCHCWAISNIIDSYTFCIWILHFSSPIHHHWQTNPLECCSSFEHPFYKHRQRHQWQQMCNMHRP